MLSIIAINYNLDSFSPVKTDEILRIMQQCQIASLYTVYVSVVQLSIPPALMSDDDPETSPQQHAALAVGVAEQMVDMMTIAFPLSI